MIIIKRHKGVGDTIAAITKATGLDKLATEDCGCNKRQEAWNSPDLLINKINGSHGFKLKIDKMFYLIHNGEKVTGMILSILPGDQIKRHSKWIKCHSSK